MKMLLYCALLLALPVANAAGQDRKPDGGLVKNGKLAHKLVVRDVQGGFAGFTGREWTIAPSGAYTIATVRNRKVELQKKGDLTKEQLARLVKALARCDLAKYAGKAKKYTGANPHVVSIKGGGREYVLSVRGGQALPGVKPGQAPASEEECFAVILQAVKQATGKR